MIEKHFPYKHRLLYVQLYLSNTLYLYNIRRSTKKIWKYCLLLWTTVNFY